MMNAVKSRSCHQTTHYFLTQTEWPNHISLRMHFDHSEVFHNNTHSNPQYSNFTVNSLLVFEKPKNSILFKCLIKIVRHFSKTKMLAIHFSKLLLTPNNRSQKVTDIAIYVALARNLWTWFITCRIIENGIFVYQLEIFNPRDRS